MNDLCEKIDGRVINFVFSTIASVTTPRERVFCPSRICTVEEAGRVRVVDRSYEPIDIFHPSRNEVQDQPVKRRVGVAFVNESVFDC